MARIVTLEDGDNKRYKVIVEMGRDPKTGRRKRRTKTFKKQRDANSWMGDMITARDNGTAIDPSKITVAEYMKHWLDNHKKPHIATTTYDNYLKRIETHIIPDLGAILLQKLEPYHLEAYFAEKRSSGRIYGEGGLSENSLKKIYVLLNSAMKKAIKMKLIKFNPLTAIDSPQPEKKEAPAMTQEEVNKILEIAKETDYFIFTFICFTFLTGLRRSEILGLEWPEVDLEKGIVEIKQRLVSKRGEGVRHEKKTKNANSKRFIKISKKLISVLKKYKKYQTEVRLMLPDEYNEEKDFVFCRPDGYPYFPNTINKKFNELLKEANLYKKYKGYCGPHLLRHTFATISIKEGTKPVIIQNMLGHSSIRTTLDIYSHVDVSMQEAAVNRLDKVINID